MNELTQNIENKLDEVIAYLREFKRQRLWNESTKLQSDDPNVQRRIELLRAWRRQAALDLDFKPYMILTNRSIMGIAMQNPQTESELERVDGIGLKKIEAYGQQILKLITEPSTEPSSSPLSIGYIPSA